MYKFFLFVVAASYRIRNDNVTYPLGFIAREINKKEISKVSSKEISKEISKFDWRNKVNVPIRNQGQCGSCWAFATIAPIEYLYTYISGKPIHISEQELISCNSHGYSCNGGWWDYDDMKKNGVYLNSSFPYDGINEPCKLVKPYDDIHVIEWYYIENDIEEIKNALMYSPVATSVSVSDDFYKYIDGVFDYDSKGPINHAVVLVGWDDSLESWILRNSWSERWGMNGYMYIKYNTNSIGTNSVFSKINCSSYSY